MRAGARRFLFLAILLCGFALSSCGGSGSSGFDLQFQQEQVNIASAIGGCRTTSGPTYCDPEPSMGSGDGFYSMLITPTLIEESQSVSCTLPYQPGCGFRVTIADIKGFDLAKTKFFLAVRYEEPFSPSWELVTSPFVVSSSNPQAFENIAVIRDSLGGNDNRKVHISVLAYSTTNGPNLSGVQDFRLNSFNADVVFVVQNLKVP